LFVAFIAAPNIDAILNIVILSLLSPLSHLEYSPFLVFSSAMASFLWTAHSEFPEHLKKNLEARVRSLPSSYLLRPVAGEVFENSDLCQERLQGWAMSQGFAVVRTSGSLKQARPRLRAERK
jgi:hypothetical protein